MRAAPWPMTIAGHERVVHPGVTPYGHATDGSAEMELTFGQRISGLTVDGREVRAAVFDEQQVRAAAGLTLVIGAVAFAYAYFEQQYVPLRIVTAASSLEFLIRVTVGLRYSPVGIVARAITLGRPAHWVSAKPKRFAWTLGLAMSVSMTVVISSGVRGLLPRTICLVCLTLMWLESVVGLCVGCEIAGFLMRRGWMAGDPAFEICAGGACDVPRRRG
jgi:hypothetical protein